MSDEAAAWYEGLAPAQAERVDSALELLRDHGPTLGRQLVDRVKTSRHHKMKELRPPSSTLRALFAFDSKGKAVVLVGGDKAGRWNGWYPEQIKRADRLLDEHEQGIGGSTACRTRTAGNRSAARGR